MDEADESSEDVDEAPTLLPDGWHVVLNTTHFSLFSGSCPRRRLRGARTSLTNSARIGLTSGVVLAGNRWVLTADPSSAGSLVLHTGRLAVGKSEALTALTAPV